MKKWCFIAVSLFSGLFASEAKLRVCEESGMVIQETSDNRKIKEFLEEIGVRFEQWELKDLSEGSSNGEILAVYRHEVERLVEENGYQAIDVVKMVPDASNREAARNKFLNEHSHKEDEVRFFVEGSGLFYLHVDEKVYLVRCEAGDLISIPENYNHWFDMSEAPYFTAIRFFLEPNGWVPYFTDSGLSKRFPEYIR